MKLVHAEEQDKNIVNELYISVRNTPFCVWNEYYPTMEEIDNDLNANTLYVIKENEKTCNVSSEWYYRFFISLEGAIFYGLTENIRKYYDDNK